MAGTKPGMTQATPILRVSNLDASLAYYTARLGFSVAWRAGGFACVARDRCSLFLCERGQGHAGTWTWTGTDDVDALHAELVASQARILQGPTNYPWGSRELHVLDPDDHVLRFAASAPAGEPTGEFPPDRTDF